MLPFAKTSGGILNEKPAHWMIPLCLLPGKPASLVPRQRVCGLSSTHRGEGQVDLCSGCYNGILLDCTYQIQFNITIAVSLADF